jgi:two-component system response regulator
VSRARILVIEDNEDDELLLLRILRQSRLASHVEVVRDGKKALDYLTHHEAKIEDLVAVFLDLNIPSIHGLKLLAMIRANDRLSHLPVIVMTTSPEDLLECQRLSVVSYVQKPVSLASFSKAIADILPLPDDSERPWDQSIRAE